MSIVRKELDLTSGSITKVLVYFFLPILGGSIFQQLYTIVDAIIVGQYVGKVGLASIDSINSLLRLPNNFFLGISTGATIIISHYYGARDNNRLSKATHTTIAFAIIGGILLSILGIILAPHMMGMMNIPADIRDETLSYLTISLGGLAVSLLYNVGAGILRAIGDSKSPFYILIVACVVNIVLDLLFVVVLGWSVAGAAIATVIAQLISAILILIVMTRSDTSCRLYISKIRIYKEDMKKIVRTGLPIGFQTSLYPIANMMIQSSINRTGTDYITSWALCGKLDFPIWVISEALASAISTFVAQNYGAGDKQRVKSGIRIGMIMTVSVIAIIGIVLYIVHVPYAKLFINEVDYDVLPMMSKMMKFLIPFYVIYVVSEVLSSAIKGIGRTIHPMMITLIGTCIFRVFWILVVVDEGSSIIKIISTYPLSWVITTGMFVVYWVVNRNTILE